MTRTAADSRRSNRRLRERSCRSMERATKTRFAFQSEGETLLGNLFLPERAKPAGVVVAVGPLTSVKEQAAGTYAQAMAERGPAAPVREPRSQYRGHQERRDRAPRRRPAD